MAKEFDEIDWIMDFFDNAADLKVAGIDRVRNFVFLWNMFENFGCGKNADLLKIKELVGLLDSYIPLKEDELIPFVAYFSERYFNPNGDKTFSLAGLKFRKNKSDQDALISVEAVLTLKEDAPVKILEALLFILYRFRNNLFHGEKDIVNLDGQIDNFINANHILCLVLDKMKSCGMVKY